MRVLQLGNGGGLNPMETNSSFLIEVGRENYLLFDCGSNVVTRLIELEEKDKEFKIAHISSVFISHIHDDHIGSLETLIFYNYFKHNRRMKILHANNQVAELLKIKIPDSIFTGCRETYNSFTDGIRSIRLSPLSIGVHTKISALCETYHGATQSNGVVIKFKNESAIVITGDTKASAKLEFEIEDELECIEARIIFHDYSNWDCPSKNVHACASDFRDEYTEKFRNSLIKYHTGSDDFNKEWVDI